MIWLGSKAKQGMKQARGDLPAGAEERADGGRQAGERLERLGALRLLSADLLRRLGADRAAGEGLHGVLVLLIAVLKPVRAILALSLYTSNHSVVGRPV